MFLIAFKTRHALLLPGGRFLSPRYGREEGAEQPRNEIDLWPHALRFHIRELVQYRPQTETVRDCEKSVTAINPRQWAGQRTVRIRDHAMVSTRRDLALSAITNYPQTVRSLELSRQTNSPQTRIVLASQQATNSPVRRIEVAITPQVSFPVRFQFIPAYVHV